MLLEYNCTGMLLQYVATCPVMSWVWVCMLCMHVVVCMMTPAADVNIHLHSSFTPRATRRLLTGAASLQQQLAPATTTTTPATTQRRRSDVPRPDLVVETSLKLAISRGPTHLCTKHYFHPNSVFNASPLCWLACSFSALSQRDSQDTCRHCKRLCAAPKVGAKRTWPSASQHLPIHL